MIEGIAVAGHHTPIIAERCTALSGSEGRVRVTVPRSHRSRLSAVCRSAALKICAPWHQRYHMGVVRWSLDAVL